MALRRILSLLSTHTKRLGDQDRTHLYLCILLLFSIAAALLTPECQAQTTTGLITGLITDSSGAVVPGAEIDIKNEATGLLRTTTSGSNGIYQVLLLPPGNYEVTVKMQGFATEIRKSVPLEVNQSDTIDFALSVSSTQQTITVTGAAPLVNTTSATLSNVIDHDLNVGLPLNGRQFTQLALLSPGSSPIQNGQQGTYTVPIGGGGVSPAVNGQQGYQNNYTMDGVLNNSTRSNVWAISPPPDAIDQFNVQAHITDAQFAISSGANINLVTRSGTNDFHGALWEFLRNDVLDAITYPATTRLLYRQNQYGVFFSGPVRAPHIFDGRNNTWFAFYWEGYRYSKSQTQTASVPTANMRKGDFSGVLGTTVIGTDSLGRPEYANEIYDPTSSVLDPDQVHHKGQYIRTPYPGNIIAPTSTNPNPINPASLAVLNHYYPLPNMNVPEGKFPNYEFNGLTNIDSDIFGLRIDRKITDKDTVFARYNRSRANELTPEGLPTYSNQLSNLTNQAAFGYTRVFDPKTILNLRVGYTYTNIRSLDQQAGSDLVNAIAGFSEALLPRYGLEIGPSISIANGPTAVSQKPAIVGPQEGIDYHVDVLKVIGHHTLGFGAMYYHIHALGDGWSASPSFTQNGTAQDGTAGPTGYGPASFLLGVVDNYSVWTGNTAMDQAVKWWGLYAQDQWQVNSKLNVSLGLRWDYVAPPIYSKIVSGLNVLTGQFIVTGAVPPAIPQATGPKGYFQPQYNGYEPRLGITYAATRSTAIHAAFAMLDDHNNSLLQQNQNLRTTWPSALSVNYTSQDIGVPKMYLNGLPAAAAVLTSTPIAGYGADPNNKIPYSMQYNLGIQQQIGASTAFKIDYVGSANRHQYFVPVANVAMYPGPGPVLAREPYPQWGGPFSFSWNAASSSYNALQVQVHKQLSHGLQFQSSYTWSKSLDISSNPYTSVEYFYNLKADWGPSSNNFKHMFVTSGVYALPIGRGRAFLGSPNKVEQAVAGGWNVGAIISLRSGIPFNAGTGSDIANIGTSAQRPNRVAGVSPYVTEKSPTAWLNKAAFQQPVAYTFGNEGRDDLYGPAHRNVDLSAMKDFGLDGPLNMQFRAEFFNLTNTVNYATPNATLSSTSFGQINAADSARVIQFALKLLF